MTTLHEQRAQLLKVHEDNLPITRDTLDSTKGKLTGALVYKLLYNMGFRISTVDTDITKYLNLLLKEEPPK